jgi:hypothetical protein
MYGADAWQVVWQVRWFDSFGWRFTIGGAIVIVNRRLLPSRRGGGWRQAPPASSNCTTDHPPGADRSNDRFSRDQLRLEADAGFSRPQLPDLGLKPSLPSGRPVWERSLCKVSSIAAEASAPHALKVPRQQGRTDGARGTPSVNPSISAVPLQVLTLSVAARLLFVPISACVTEPGPAGTPS